SPQRGEGAGCRCDRDFNSNKSHQRACDVSTPSPPIATRQLADLGPGILAASMFASSNVMSKLVLNAGADVLTLSVFRGVVGVALLFIWLRVGTPPRPHNPRQRWISLGLGLIFACVVFGLFA